MTEGQRQALRRLNIQTIVISILAILLSCVSLLMNILTARLTP